MMNRPCLVLAALILTSECGAQAPAAEKPAMTDAPGKEPAAAPKGAATYRPAASQLVREGAFLRNRRGRLLQVDNVWFYVFDRDAEGMSEPPMIVQPGVSLREMQRIVNASSSTITFTVTGQVFVYRGRNFFLPTFFAVVASSPTPGAALPSKGSEAGQSASEPDPTVESLLESLRGTAAPAPVVPPPRTSPSQGATGRPGAAREASASAPSPLMREGLTITSRRGRVRPLGEGSLVFTTDNGAASAGGSEPGMVLMPCLNLERIEQLLQRHGERLVFSMSGRVFVHEERNFLLPTSFKIEIDRDGNVVPGQ